VDENGNVNNDRVFQFNEQPQEMGTIRITLADGTVLELTADDSRLAIIYSGVQANGLPYISKDAPVAAGAYQVSVQFTQRDEQGRVVHLGVKVGAMLIKPADADFAVEDKEACADTENVIDDMITNNNNLPFTIVIVKNVAMGEVNVILPAGWEVNIPVGAGVDELVAALEKLPAIVEMESSFCGVVKPRSLAYFSSVLPPSSSASCAKAQLQEFAIASSKVCVPCQPEQVTVTPATSTLPLQVKVRVFRSLMFSIAAAAVTSLKIEPGVNFAFRQRLI
jgi:hypothetical protein